MHNSAEIKFQSISSGWPGWGICLALISVDEDSVETVASSTYFCWIAVVSCDLHLVSWDEMGHSTAGRNVHTTTLRNICSTDTRIILFDEDISSVYS